MVFDDILLAKLRPGQRIKLEAHAGCCAHDALCDRCEDVLA